MENFKVKNYKIICQQLSNLYAKKNAEYGDSFGEVFREDGLNVCLAQIKHKIRRAMTIVDKDDVNFESLEDTLKDIANYSIMTYMEYILNSQEDNDKEMTKKEKAIYDYKSIINKKVRECKFFNDTEKLEIIKDISEIKTINECVCNLVCVLKLIVNKFYKYYTTECDEKVVNIILNALDIFKLQFGLLLEIEDENCDSLIDALIEATEEVDKMDFDNIIENLKIWCE